MASRFPGSTREQLAVVVEVSGGGGRGNCWAHFPQPATGTWPNVNWDDVDLFESTFDAFDAAGVKVWLQVEPARCEVPMLIDLLYQQYGHHSSVIGFGVDDEWYRKDSRAPASRSPTRRPRRGSRRSAKDADDLVLVKHWLIEKMPPTHRDGLVFVDDSQGHGSLANMVNEFSGVGRRVRAGAGRLPVRLPVRQVVVEHAARPAARHRQRPARRRIPNTRDLLWVDFTAYDIWPPSSATCDPVSRLSDPRPA